MLAAGVVLTFRKTISTVSIPVPILSPEKVDKVDEWLRGVLWEHQLPGEETEVEVHRTKGRVVFSDGSMKMIQGVREIFEILNSEEKAGDAQGKIILIGRHLQGVDFEKSLLGVIES